MKCGAMKLFSIFFKARRCQTCSILRIVLTDSKLIWKEQREEFYGNNGGKSFCSSIAHDASRHLHVRTRRGLQSIKLDEI